MKSNSSKKGMKKKPIKQGFLKKDNSIHTSIMPIQPTIPPMPKPIQNVKTIKVTQASNKNTIVNNINMPTQPSVPPMPKPTRSNPNKKTHDSNN